MLVGSFPAPPILGRSCSSSPKFDCVLFIAFFFPAPFLRLGSLSSSSNNRRERAFSWRGLSPAQSSCLPWRIHQVLELFSVALREARARPLFFRSLSSM